MSIAKVIEVTASSRSSFDDAVRDGIARVAKTVNDVRGAWISEQKVSVEDGNVTEFRVTMRVSFLVGDDQA